MECEDDWEDEFEEEELYQWDDDNDTEDQEDPWKYTPFLGNQ